MTFEEWWANYVIAPAEKNGDRIPASTLNDMKKRYAHCWNSAIEAVDEQIVFTDEKVSTVILPSIRASV